jgi:hypothetical protein
VQHSTQLVVAFELTSSATRSLKLQVLLMLLLLLAVVVCEQEITNCEWSQISIVSTLWSCANGQNTTRRVFCRLSTAKGLVEEPLGSAYSW